MREADIRPADLLNEYLRLSAEDAVRLFSDASSFNERACPGCGADKPEPAFEKNGFSFVHCGTCRTLYANPAPVAELLSEFYRDSPSQQYWGGTFFPAVAEARRAQIFRPRAARIRELVQQTGGTTNRLVDIGAGTGIFLEECKTVGLSTWLGAVEPNGDLANTCRSKGFETFQGFAADAASDSNWRAGADFVSCFEVIEHVLDCATFVHELAILVKPGGTLLMTGLCGSGYDILTLGPHSKAVSPPHHLNFLSRDGISALLDRCGLEELRFITPGQLDVDIVGNTDRELGGLDLDPFTRHLLDEADQQTKTNFQTFLSENGLSSHMWVVARKPL